MSEVHRGNFGGGQEPAHEPSSTPSAEAAASLPSEAIDFAGRFFEAARKGGESSFALFDAAFTYTRERGGPGISNLTNDKGDSLIMLAAYHGHDEIVKLLLENGADPNRLNDRGQSPLAGVVFKNKGLCVLELLKGGADPEIGMPSALACCEMFKQEDFRALFLEQIEKLRPGSLQAVNGNGTHAQDMNGNGVHDTNGSELHDTNGTHDTNGDGVHDANGDTTPAHETPVHDTPVHNTNAHDTTPENIQSDANNINGES